MGIFSRSMAIAAVVAAASALGAGFAGAQATVTTCKDGTTSATSGRGACSGHGGVAKTAKAGKTTTPKATVAAPATTKKGAATVTCTDGTASKGGRGACSGHGGVKGATALTTPAPATSASTAKGSKPSNATKGSGSAEDNNPTGAIAKCKDGTYSHSKHRQGACSGHGGVASWM